MVWIPVGIEYFRVFPIERAVVKPVNRKNNYCSSWNGHTFNCGGLLTVSIKSITQRDNTGIIALIQKSSVDTSLNLEYHTV